MASQLEVAAPASLVSAPQVRFHLSLNAANLDRAVEFLRVLLGVEPAKCRPDYAKFELDNPPLVLSLEPYAATPGGNLNHLGFRVADAAALVEVQRRLELAGISTRRENGVECCYAKQTKFWVHDPDGNMWEIYTLDEDIEHRGDARLPVIQPEEQPATGPAPAVWNHRLGQAFPTRLPILDGTVDVAMWQGTLNEPILPDELARRLQEMQRVLKPGGKLQMHLLTADRTVTQTPIALPGPAAAVKHVPVDQEVLLLLANAGFANPHFTYHASHPCFHLGEAALRETRLEATRT